MIVMPGAGDGLIGGIPVMPPLQPTAPDNTTMTNTSMASTEGTTSETVPLETTTSGSTTETTDSGAQIAYENMGATAADPALVQEVDSDYDGIACEELMA